MLGMVVDMVADTAGADTDEQAAAIAAAYPDAADKAVDAIAAAEPVAGRLRGAAARPSSGLEFPAAPADAYPVGPDAARALFAGCDGGEFEALGRRRLPVVLAAPAEDGFLGRGIRHVCEAPAAMWASW